MTKRFIELLRKYRQLHLGDVINYSLMNEILISHHSTGIEGSSLTEEESRLLITEGITAKGKPLSDHNMVKDHQDILEGMLVWAEKKRAVSPEMVRELNAGVMRTTGGIINAVAGSYDSSKGDFRKSNVYVGDRYFMAYQKVESEVDKLCRKLDMELRNVRKTEDIYNLAFDAHFYLVSIHPFADGNGRTSRLLMNYILAYHDQPLAIIFKEDKQEYFGALEASRSGNEVNLIPIRNFLYSQQEKYFFKEIQKYNKPSMELED